MSRFFETADTKSVPDYCLLQKGDSRFPLSCKTALHFAIFLGDNPGFPFLGEKGHPCCAALIKSRGAETLKSRPYRFLFGNPFFFAYRRQTGVILAYIDGCFTILQSVFRCFLFHNFDSGPGRDEGREFG